MAFPNRRCQRKADITLSGNFICHLITEVTDTLNINDTAHWEEITKRKRDNGKQRNMEIGTGNGKGNIV